MFMPRFNNTYVNIGIELKALQVSCNSLCSDCTFAFLFRILRIDRANIPGKLKNLSTCLHYHRCCSLTILCVCDHEWGKKWILNMELAKVYLHSCEGVITPFKLPFLPLSEWPDLEKWQKHGNKSRLGH